jgi:hypothetical protein
LDLDVNGLMVEDDVFDIFGLNIDSSDTGIRFCIKSISFHLQSKIEDDYGKFHQTALL